MTRVKRYDCETYSIFDIKEYVEKKGYKTEKKYYRQSDRLFVFDTNINIEFPCIDGNNHIDAYICFEDCPRTKYFEESKKLYESLKRKFALKESRFCEFIKDVEKMEIIDWRKKGKRIPGKKLMLGKSLWTLWKK